VPNHLFSYLNANSGTDPNSAIGDEGAKILIGNIRDTRNMLSSLGVSIPVGTSDAGSYFNNKVLAEVDYGVSFVSCLVLSHKKLKPYHSWLMCTRGLQMCQQRTLLPGHQPSSKILILHKRTT